MTNAFEIVNQQMQQLEELSGLLSQELDAFTHRDPAKIIDIAESKVKTLTTITELDAQLSQLPNLSALKSEAKFSQLVEQCAVKLNELKTQNAVNERVIKTSLNNVTQLKQSLLSLKNANAMTYDKKGKAMTQTLGAGIKA
ncbi:flagellar protein FlgN [Saccharobesus litoralis]|uniref:Flagellar protein FlgN n=1 Tax=Saccharobesus litoralis TaxID=2172099 RepID=A0A2S0VUX1_9ALTE|nr:flagellar export chaperone FlgN [Saccharobesus litoralis]AWB67962.1 flagellar protein FlgN [Saccharobesus litoralis]